MKLKTAIKFIQLPLKLNSGTKPIPPSMKLKTFKFTLAAAGLLLGLGSSSQAAITWNFDYSDPTASTWTTAARSSLATAADWISSYFPTYTANVTMKVTGSNENSTTLASAGSASYISTPGFADLGVVGKKIQSNGADDANGPDLDGEVDANFFHSWAFGNSVSGSEYDFTETMFHELGHAMGFLSRIPQGGITTPISLSPFDQYVTNGQGQSLVDPVTFLTDSKWTIASIGGTGTVPATPDTGLYFAGPNAMAANGGHAVPLYSPNPWEGGSSGSHLDDKYYTSPNQKTMNAATPFGLGVRQFGPIEQGIWKDLGYTVVPEPSASLLLGTLGLLALGRRTRRAVQAGA